VRTTDTTISDLLHVWTHLAWQNRAEHERLGLSQIEVFAQAKDWLSKHGATTAWLDADPAFIFGVIPGDVPVTWFLATEDFFATGASGVRQGRRFVKEAFRKHGRLTTVSSSPHPDAARWFRLLGFEKLETSLGADIYTYG
jgi:hypothetical protein